MYAKSIGKTGISGGAWPRDTKLKSIRIAGKTVGQTWAKLLPNEAVWSKRRVGIGEAKRKFRFSMAGGITGRKSSRLPALDAIQVRDGDALIAKLLDQLQISLLSVNKQLLKKLTDLKQVLATDYREAEWAAVEDRPENDSPRRG